MKQGGYTLIGILIYVTIAAASLFALAMIFRSSLETRSLLDAQRRLREASTLAKVQVRERLEAAGTVTTPASGSSSTLSMDAPNASESPATFFLSAGRLMLQLGSGAPQAITPSDVTVSAFTATRLAGSPASVRIDLTFSDTAIRAAPTLSSSFAVTLRYD